MTPLNKSVLSVFWAHTNNVLKLPPWNLLIPIIPQAVCWVKNVAFHLYLFPPCQKDFSNNACTGQGWAPQHYIVFLYWGFPHLPHIIDSWLLSAKLWCGLDLIANSGLVAKSSYWDNFNTQQTVSLYIIFLCRFWNQSDSAQHVTVLLVFYCLLMNISSLRIFWKLIKFNE